MAYLDLVLTDAASAVSSADRPGAVSVAAIKPLYYLDGTASLTDQAK
jgi:hypothetical protein